MLDRQQYFNINLIPANLYTLVAAIFYGFACFLVAGVIYVHEQINTQLKIALESERKKFNRLAHIDELTGIGNRLEFKSKLGCSIEKAKANNEKVGIIYIDLDDFKPVNDIHGHEIGDHVLCIAAQRIKLHVRSSDTVVRLGGDEFAVILNSIDSKSRVDNIAKLMIKEINTAIIFGNIEIQVGASAGTSLFPDDTQDPKELLNAADKNMYARKNNKNN